MTAQQEGKTAKSASATPNQPQVQVPSREASRELDALIDEKVMGYTWEPVVSGDIVPPTVTHRLRGTSHIRAERHADGHVVVSNGRKYSTDLNAAFTALSEVGGIVTITRMQPDEWHVRLHGAKDGWWGATLPLAICCALLAAVEPLSMEARAAARDTA